jgi:glutathione-regulated potassium-efflux system ancillary protein KefG
MSKTLVIVAHPDIAASRTNRQVADVLAQQPHCTVRQLYTIYPDFKIDIAAEQALLLAHDTVVLQFPVYWYSSPALLKEWLDRVLTRGFAYGDGTALVGKKLQISCAAGGAEAVYSATGRNKYTMTEFLRPFEVTAQLCGMTYLPPFAIHAAHLLTDAEISAQAEALVAKIGS